MGFWTPPAPSVATTRAINGVVAVAPPGRLLSDGQLLPEYELRGGRVVSEVAIPRLKTGEATDSTQGDFFVVTGYLGTETLVVDPGQGGLHVVVTEATTAQTAQIVPIAKSLTSSTPSGVSASSGGPTPVPEAAPSGAYEQLDYFPEATPSAFYSQPASDSNPLNQGSTLTSQSGDTYSLLNPPTGLSPAQQQAIGDAVAYALGLGQPEPDNSWQEYFAAGFGGL